MEMLDADERNRFDALLESVLAELPAAIRDLLEETPLIVEDAPDEALLLEVGLDPQEDDLCGLHSGVPLTERSVEGGDLGPQLIHLFRAGIIDHAGGWDEGDEPVRREIRITLLHEIGHHFGLDEEDLEELGYG